ncbi:response regulator transcription factor [bacterium]|jgi:DNA-binding response OmpR family regulator|nr:response regulator transcription factor [bacterium]
MEKHRILIIEDNADTRRFLEAMLSKEFEIITAENAVIGIDYARNKSPDLILLDIMLPILSGYDACSLLKKDERTKRIPIIFLSAKNTVTDITQGLSTGADDYIPKPFDYKELVARIRARLRTDDGSSTQPFQVGELRIDPAKREVTYSGKKIMLTLTEFDILSLLASKVGAVLSREDILKEVWRDDSQKTNDRTIDVHIRALRRKVPALTKHIMSIYGVGYKYEK